MPTLVAVHGGPGLSHHYMEGLDPLATSTLRVVSYDQRGVGGSTAAPPGANTLQDHVADLEALRITLRVDRLKLLGHSFGGLVVLAYAIAHPEHTERLLLVDAIPPTMWSWQLAQQRFRLRQLLLQQQGLVPTPLPAAEGDDCAPRLRAVLPVYFADPRHPMAQTLGATRCHDGVREQTWTDIGPYDLRTALAAVTTPTLLVEGAEDPFGTQMLDELAASMPQASPSTVVLPACGHIPWEECPEAFFAAVAPFLRDDRAP